MRPLGIASSASWNRFTCHHKTTSYILVSVGKVGNQVVAVNYYGDEGAHVAKCLWYMLRHRDIKLFDATTPCACACVISRQLQREWKDGLTEALSRVPVEGRGEWLGGEFQGFQFHASFEKQGGGL